VNVTIFGTGYVGLVQAAVLADTGNHVMCVDVDESKVEQLRNGFVPIFEPGLEDMVRRNSAAGRLQFTTHAKRGIDFARIQFIAVGTPPDEDGSADLRYVLAVADTIAAGMEEPRIVVVKSTVPVGTGDKVLAKIAARLAMRGRTDLAYDVASNPEFLKEGAAVADCTKPDRIVIGVRRSETEDALRELYAPFNRNHEKIIVMDVRSAELTKYAANCMLATKISFMNEIANLADRLGADIEKVRHGIGSDPRIGYHFIYPGLSAMGGHAFPKDVQALIRTARRDRFRRGGAARRGDPQQRRQKTLPRSRRSSSHFAGRHRRARLLHVWGLAFKPNTDDMREAAGAGDNGGACGRRVQKCARFDP
jgi:UDPglucose 6-dehydrogenase